MPRPDAHDPAPGSPALGSPALGSPALRHPTLPGGPRMPRSVIRRPPPFAPPPFAPPGRGRGGPVRRTVRPVRARRSPPTAAIAVALVLAGLFAVAAGLGQATGFELGNPFRGADKPPPRAFPVLEPSRPLRLAIPSLRVQAPVRDVGLADDGSVAVPPLSRHNEAGWFDRGPTPGQFGPAVIVGHADTRTGPSVFHDLGTLRPGQRIEVTRQDRRVAVFEINSVERFAKTAVPVQRVYGDFSRPSLRLMTCGGRWVGGRTGYSDNVVVFASLVSSRRT